MLNNLFWGIFPNQVFTSSLNLINVVTINSSSNTSATTHSLTSVPVGALIVLTTACGFAQTDCTVSSSPSLTWSRRVDTSAATSGDCEVFTAIYTAGGSITVTSNWGSTSQSSVCYVMTNIGTTITGSKSNTVAKTTPSASISTIRDNSFIFGVSSDWNAISGSRTYVGNPTESFYNYGASDYAGYHYYRYAPVAGSYTIGLSAPTGQSAGTCLLEILCPTSSVPDVTPPSSFTLSTSSISTSSVGLSWTTATDNDAISGYNVYVTGVLAGITSDTAYFVTGLVSGTAYSIFARAKDYSNNSTDSNTINITTPLTSSARQNLIVNDGFESATWRWTGSFDTASEQRCCIYSLGISTNRAYTGTKSMRFELRDTDPVISSSVRTEMELNGISELETMERWYGLAYYLDNGWPEDSFAESILQWHDSSGPCPPLSIQVYDGHMWLQQCIEGIGNTPNDLGPVIADQWFTVVLHVKWAVDSTGIIQCWVNGVSKVNKSGLRTNSTDGSYMKIGMNKFNWAPSGGALHSNQTLRVFYIDDIRIGNENATYNDVVP